MTNEELLQQQGDIFENVFYGSENEPIVNILNRAGVTLMDNGRRWRYKDKIRNTPSGLDWQRALQLEFGITIIITK
jgi:hypothetical protein